MLASTQPFSIRIGALNRRALRPVLAAAQEFFAAVDAGRIGGDIGRLARLQNGVALSAQNAVDCPEVRAMREIIDCICASNLMADIADREFLPSQTSIRRQTATGTPLPWHQDSCPMGHSDGMVVWIPLTDIDADTPSLEFADGVFEPLPHTSGAHGFAALADPQQWRIRRLPPLMAGDVAVFHPDAVHRTALTATMTKTRYSCDLRVGRVLCG